MSNDLIKQQRIERTMTLMLSEGFFELLVGDVASGTMLVEFCRQRDIDFQLINTWIQNDDDRRIRYKAATDVREIHHKDEILHELLSYLRADVTQAFREDGSMREFSEMPENLRRLISGFEVEDIYQGSGESRAWVGHLKKIKLWDKPRGIELLMKHLKMLIDRHDITGRMTLVDLLLTHNDNDKPAQLPEPPRTIQ